MKSPEYFQIYATEEIGGGGSGVSPFWESMMCHDKPNIDNFQKIWNVFKSSSDGVDGLLGPDWGKVVSEKFNSSFEKD